ncbi:hypothetical protein KKB83_04835 [Patescibacteria group bacterium]|nr:hypothetical protein [Patescibacteria group bacterium]
MSTSYLLIARNQELTISIDIDRKVIYPTPQGSIGIEQIRELICWAHFKPYRSKEKVVVIQQADCLTVQAQNCLLKTLEEPPENTYIFLIAQSKDHFLPTVLSRCQVMNWEKDSRLQEFFKGEITVANIEDTGNLVGRFLDSLTEPLPQAFKYLDKLTTKLNRAELEGLLAQAVRQTYRKFLETQKPVLLQTADQIEKTRQAVGRQANSKLALENLVLSLNSFPRLRPV